MAAFDDQHQVTRGRGVTGGEMKIDAEFRPDHALGVAHVFRRVEPEGGRKRKGGGRGGRMVRPGSLFAAAAASSTWWTSCSATVLPRSVASAPWRREARRPPDMLMMN